MRLSEEIRQFAMRYAPDDPVLGPPPPGQFAAWADEVRALELALAKAARALRSELGTKRCMCSFEHDRLCDCGRAVVRGALADPLIAAAAKEANDGK